VDFAAGIDPLVSIFWKSKVTFWHLILCLLAAGNCPGFGRAEMLRAAAAKFSKVDRLCLFVLCAGALIDRPRAIDWKKDSKNKGL